MLAIVGFIAVSNCSQIPENNDPVLGTWVRTETQNTDGASKSDSDPISEEWIFNDVYLGRYQQYSNTDIIYYTDFEWEVIDDVYTITYLGEEIPEVRVSLQQSSDEEVLELENGDVFATRR